MGAPLNALQAAIYTRLTEYSALTTALGDSKVYDHVPQNTVAPYVVIGDDTMTDDDTKTGNGWDCTLTIHCWDFMAAGRKSVKAIMSLIYDTLHKQESLITVSGFTLVLLYCDFQTTIQEQEEPAPDHYYHGVQRFRALISDTIS